MVEGSVVQKLSSGGAMRSKTSMQVNHWREPVSGGPINPDSCGAIALALVWVSLSLCSCGLDGGRNKDKRQIDTRAKL